MNKEIKALDLAISKLQEEKQKAIKKAEIEEKSKQKSKNVEITKQDSSLIKKLTKRCEWWRTEGQKVKKVISVTIEANILWTEEKTPFVDGYDFLYKGKPFDDSILLDALKNELKTAQSEINQICDSAAQLKKKYKGARIVDDIFS